MPSQVEWETWSTSCGIKGTPLLSALLFLEFLTSFPLDFMHLVWENIARTLTDLISDKDFKNLPKGNWKHVLNKKDWKAVGKVCKESGDTMPAAFGCCVPNIAEEQSHFIAESWSNWILYLGPVLLCKRLKRENYIHFVKLSNLLTKCLQFRLSPAHINKIEISLASWVQEYKRYVA